MRAIRRYLLAGGSMPVVAVTPRRLVPLPARDDEAAATQTQQTVQATVGRWTSPSRRTPPSPRPPPTS
jgi:hypothetical protein